MELPQLRVERLGVVLEPEPNNPAEAQGVLNPGGVLGPDHAYHLFPRLVAHGNYSRIGHAVVTHEDRPRVERRGVALEPTGAWWDARGVEDPRVVHRPDWGGYVMTYAAHGADKRARVAWAGSPDLQRWQSWGLVPFADDPFPVTPYANKDALLWPRPVLAPDGVRAEALLHRPWLPDQPPSMWLSYRPLGAPPNAPWGQHTLLLAPQETWERERVGAGPPPLPRTQQGRMTDWLVFYHGMAYDEGRQRVYSAGLALLDPDSPHRVLARSRHPLLVPQTAAERRPQADTPTAVGNVVFPTALEECENSLVLYYGAADSRICAAIVRAA